MGAPNIIIYTGAHVATTPVANVIAFTDRPLPTGVTASHNYRLCVFEFPSLVPNSNGIGQLVLDMYPAAVAEPLGTPTLSIKLSEMPGTTPFKFRMEHGGDAVFVDDTGKVNFDVTGFTRLGDFDARDRSQF